jgi:hypothetical protein
MIRAGLEYFFQRKNINLQVFSMFFFLKKDLIVNQKAYTYI